MSAKDDTNSATLYNLGICYEQGIGVEKNDENEEQTITNKSHVFPFSFRKQYQEEQLQSWNDYQLNLTKSLTCLS
ncbi:unnamed protein product [Rotaria sordida]|uniref:Uncharacterized protein n=1 Tax=Rotaria sordida TaxID=392033 RepID=A0A819DS17_9BILA|nr:unnamed protein product [Rotaria sordida]